MKEHTFHLDTSSSPAKFEFSETFNVVVPFIDRHLTEDRGEKIAILCSNGESVRYSELADRINRCGNLLLDKGMKAGERLLMVVKDAPEFFYLFWGSIKAGIIPVPLNTLLRSQDFAFLIEDSECSGLVYSEEFSVEVEGALDSTQLKPDLVLKSESANKGLLQLFMDVSPKLEPAPTQSDSDCFWLYSSGTTGRPKGAIHLHRDMMVTSQYYGVETLGISEADVCYSAAKLFFAYGLGNAMTFPLWTGATCVLDAGRPTPDSTFANIERFQPSLYFGVPTLYAAQLQALESKKVDFSSLRQCISAGEALPPDIFKRWKEKTGTVILDGIGSTELLHIFISNRPDDLKPGTSGKLVPGYEGRIVDEKDNEVPPGEEGRLQVKGSSSLRCYWNNEEKTSQTIQHGWVNTGDSYRVDEEGFFVYGGRSDDMMKVGGIWCSPFEIEARLVEHPKVLEAAVVGREDPSGLIKPEAHVVLNDPENQSEDLSGELLEHCKSGLAPYKYPRWIQFLEELPKTATGKIQRFKLRN